MPGLDPVPDITYEEAFDFKELPCRLFVFGGGPVGVDLGRTRVQPCAPRPEGRLGARRHHQIPPLSIQALGVGANARSPVSPYLNHIVPIEYLRLSRAPSPPARLGHMKTARRSQGDGHVVMWLLIAGLAARTSRDSGRACLGVLVDGRRGFAVAWHRRLGVTAPTGLRAQFPTWTQPPALDCASRRRAPPELRHRPVPSCQARTAGLGRAHRAPARRRPTPPPRRPRA